MLRTAIVGSGNVGCDILSKIARSESLTCSMLVGRTRNSAGLRYAAERGVRALCGGVDELLTDPTSFDLVFDATSAIAHEQHAGKLQQAGKIVINLTPAEQGKWCVPVINGSDVRYERNINMVTCGGQAALPIAYAIAQLHTRIEYIEVVSSISAKSAGPATRLNVNQYLNTTEGAMRFFTGCARTKAILNINPAEPSVSMQTAVSVLVENADVEAIRQKIVEAVTAVRAYVPGYMLLVEPYVDGKRVFTMVRVNGCGDFLPSYAGNLDIITCAAVNVAERMSQTPKMRSASALAS